MAELLRPVILHVFSSFEAAGTQKRTLEIIRYTAGEFQHFVLSMDGNLCAASCLSPGEAGLLHILPVPPLVPDDLASFGPILRKLGVIWRLGRNTVWLRALMEKLNPALVLTYNLGAASALLASRLRRDTPVIHAEDGFSGDPKRGLPEARNLLRRIVTRHASAVVVPSHSLLAIARGKLRLRPPIRLIPNGVPIKRSEPVPRCPLRARLGLSSAELIIGCVAHLRPEKGHLTLVRAFSQAAIPNAHLVLIGDGPIRLLIESEVTRLRLTGRVHLLGTVSDPSPYFPSMDIFALASDTEQMPLALLEAMAQKLPIVCTDVGDCRRMLGTQPFPAVVPARDVSSLADSLRLLAGNEDLRRVAGAQNQLRCRQKYNIETMLQTYRSLYLASIKNSRENFQEYPVHDDRSQQMRNRTPSPLQRERFRWHRVHSHKSGAICARMGRHSSTIWSLL